MQAHGLTATEALDAAAPYTGAVYTCDYVHSDVGDDFELDGLSAAEALAAVAGDRVHDFKWDARGEVTTVQVWTENPERLRHVWSSDPDCPAYMLMDLTVGLHTDDGRLDEIVDATVRYEGSPTVRLERWVALDQLVGSWVPLELDGSSHTAADIEIVANLSAGDSSGEIALYAERKNGESDAWDVARWPAP